MLPLPPLLLRIEEVTGWTSNSTFPFCLERLLSFPRRHRMCSSAKQTRLKNSFFRSLANSYSSQRFKLVWINIHAYPNRRFNSIFFYCIIYHLSLSIRARWGESLVIFVARLVEHNISDVYSLLISRVQFHLQFEPRCIFRSHREYLSRTRHLRDI